MPDAAHCDLLAGLFREGGPTFRHRMGLRRVGLHSFYSPSSEGRAIRAEKARVLRGPQGDAHLLTSEVGRPALHEFAQLLDAPLPYATVETTNSSDDAARAITLLLEPDLLLLVNPPRWELAWASVCFPTRWSLEGKRLRPVAEIHGVVPALNEELGRKIATFFERLTPWQPTGGEGWARANWGLTTSAERNQHPRIPVKPILPATPPEEIFLRIESQHFCKLPRTGAIAFGIRIANFALSEVLSRADLRASLREKLRTMPAGVAAYKGIPPDWWQRLP